MRDPVGPGDTMLRQWKALAKIENKRAQEVWGRSASAYQRPNTFEAPEITAARKQRDDQIEAWNDAGLSVREISARTGLARTSVNRILRIRRLQAATAVNAQKQLAR